MVVTSHFLPTPRLLLSATDKQFGNLLARIRRYVCECRESLHRSVRPGAVEKYRLGQSSDGVRQYNCITGYYVILSFSLLLLLSPSSLDFFTSSGLFCSSANLLVSRANLTVAAIIPSQQKASTQSSRHFSFPGPTSKRERQVPQRLYCEVYTDYGASRCIMCELSFCPHDLSKTYTHTTLTRSSRSSITSST